MGNSQPTNRTGKQATDQKVENAKKLGVLSLTEHNLEEIPAKVFEPDLAGKLRTLDLSSNKLSRITPKMENLTELKSLNLDQNMLPAGSLTVVSKFTKLQKLSLAGNQLGKFPARKDAPVPRSNPPPTAILPELPATLRDVNLASNFLTNIPSSILSQNLTRLEKLDLSGNQLTSVGEVWVLVNLAELRLSRNLLSSLPEVMGSMKKLKVLSLEDNQFSVHSTVFNDTNNPQPLPKSLFEDTPLIDLNLHGNNMTNTQLNDFEGFQVFLDRRAKVKSKTLQNLSVCGLK